MREFVTDESDMATEVEMRERQLSIDIIRSRVVEVQPNGICYNCDEPVDHPKKFCDSDCASDFNKRNRK